MDLHTFQSLPTDEIAQIVRERGPGVVVFPINGTRRWFMLEHGPAAGQDFVGEYINQVGKRQIELYRMFFDHGVHTLLSPIFGPDILQRGGGYGEFIQRGLSWCAQDKDFLAFYDAYGVRVRAYGDARRYLENTPYAHVPDAFDQVAQHTSAHESHRLFFGLCAHDATETVAEIALRYHQEHGCLPGKREIVKAYYGEYVRPADLFIGFGPFSAFDMPLITTGNVDLYFTIAPSPYLNVQTLRAILYDHIYARAEPEPDYPAMTEADLAALGHFYRLNQNVVLGTGVQSARGGIWIPYEEGYQQLAA